MRKEWFTYCLRMLLVIMAIAGGHKNLMADSFSTLSSAPDTGLVFEKTASWTGGRMPGAYTYDEKPDGQIINRLFTATNNAAITIEDGFVYLNGSLSLKNSNTLTISGNAVLIVSENIEISDNSSINIKERASLYVKGDFNTYDKTNNNATTNVKMDSKSNFAVEGRINSVSGAKLTITSDKTGSGNQADIYVFTNDASNIDIVNKQGKTTSISIQGEAAFNSNENSLKEIVITATALLPIELVSFQVFKTTDLYIFNWVTASEVENDYFTLEYSINGVDFNKIDYVHGAGTTSETSEYEYRWDEAPEFDVVYFRLKQTDYNGEYTYSDVIVASHKKSSGANGTFRYGPLNLQIVDGELRYIVK